MPSTKCEALSYPTHFLKSRGSAIKNNFLDYRTKQAKLFARRNDFYALFASNKAKHILNRHFCAPVVTQFIVKYKEKSKKVPFLKVYHFSISQHFSNVKVVVVQAVIAQYNLIKNKLPPNR